MGRWRIGRVVNGTRVVVTGTGSITSLGQTTRETWEAVKAGRSGVRRVQAFDPSEMPSKVASEVIGFKPEERLDRKEARRMSRFVQFAMVATREALGESGLQITEANRDQVGVLVGSAIGGLEEIEEAHTILKERGPSRISPFTVPMMIADMGAGQISISLGARGPNFCTVSACSSGAHAIGEAFEIIRRGDATAMIAGGSEACVTPLALAAFCASRAVSTRQVEPQLASRPFDLERDGFVMGEGAGILILEQLDSARKRGAPIIAEIVGAGSGRAVISGQAIEGGVAPPTITLEHPGPQCDLDYIPQGARELDVKLALSNSFGFGGHNASLLFKQFRG